MPELCSSSKDRELRDRQTCKWQQMQGLTLKFTIRHRENRVRFHFVSRQYFDAFKILIVNELTASFVFVRALTEMFVERSFWRESSGRAAALVNRAVHSSEFCLRSTVLAVGLTARLPDGLLLLADRLAQLARNRHRLERGVDHLPGARLLRRVLGLGLQQLGVRENHAELVIELVE